MQPLGPPRDLPAVHVGHRHVGQQQVERLPREQVQRYLRALPKVAREKRIIPLATVKDDIEKGLAGQSSENKIRALLGNVRVDMNEAYFGPPPTPPPAPKPE